MLTDALLTLSDGQGITAAGPTNSTNTIDLSDKRDMGPGHQLFLVVTIPKVTAAKKLKVAAVLSAAAALTSPVTVCETGELASTEVKAGRTPIVLPLAQLNDSSQFPGMRYLGAQFTSETDADFEVNAYITDSAPSEGRYYDSGFSVY